LPKKPKNGGIPAKDNKVKKNKIKRKFILLKLFKLFNVIKSFKLKENNK
jgi:hypothetical protein